MKSSLSNVPWPSPINAAMVGGKSPQVSEPRFDDDALYYVQSLPEEKNRCTIMRYDGKQSQSLLARPINVKSKVHEYGGGAYTLGAGYLYFVVADDQRIYRLDILNLDTSKADSQRELPIPEALTPETKAELRFADLHFDAFYQRLLAVCEDHRQTETAKNIEARTSLVAISLETETLGEIQTLASGSDFYSNPRVSPDGKHLCWISWMHPNMPWDNTTLEIASLDASGNPMQIQKAGNGDESLCQPRWSPNGELFVISDRREWWNIYHCQFSDREDLLLANVPALENIAPIQAEFATPQWTFNMSTYAFLSADEILATYTQNGCWQLCRIQRSDSCWNLKLELNEIATTISDIAAHNKQAAFVCANDVEGLQIKLLNEKAYSCISFSENTLSKDGISQAKPLEFSTRNGENAHAFYYAPTNALYESEKGKLPPAIVICHGGPTGASDTALNLKIQFWTTRGFAVCDVNYRGSTGYGKSYRQRLYKGWGEVDVDDLCSAAEYLIKQQLADPDKLIVKGSSAGGFSVLATLATRKVFKAGVSLYGIADLEVLATDTHKFEARYLDQLVGTYPEQADLYRARSPIHFTEQFNCPLLVFQGLEDKVVPPNQAELIVNAVKNSGLPVAYRTFTDEGHGFRKTENIETMLNDELYFYCKVFSLPLPEDCNSTLFIHNLKSAN